jgi:osmoprotectant transport system ATP-binding protein
MVADFVGTDRGLKRLRVTSIDLEFLEHPPTVGPDAGLDAVRDAITRADVEGQNPDWVAVVDGAGELRGSVTRAAADGEGVVADHVQRIEAWVPSDGSLQDALAAMLLTRGGWIAVIDGDRFLGVLTPEAVYRSLRQSLADAERTDSLRSPASSAG